MTPDFALDLTHDAIALLARAEGGWRPLGSVALSDPALGAALSILRGQAEGAGPTGLRSLLLLPQSQILFTEAPLAPEGGAAQEALIRAALEGRTPYALHELVFDWQARDGRCAVAVIARETLDEAESFAKAHGFHPISFAAWPAPGRFDGPAWFGPAAGAAAELPPGATVQRESGPCVLLPDAPIPAFASRRAPPAPQEPPAAPQAPQTADKAVAEKPQPPAAESPAPHHRPRLTPRPAGPGLGQPLRAFWARITAPRRAPRARSAKPAAPAARALRRGPSATSLVLAGALLLALAALAAWSSYYLAATGQIESSLTPEGAGATDLAETGAATGSLPTPDEEMLADGEDPLLLESAAGGDPGPDPAGNGATSSEADIRAEATPKASPLPALPPEASPPPPPPEGPTGATDLAENTAPLLPEPQSEPQPKPQSEPLPEPLAEAAAPPLQPTPAGTLTPEGVMLYQGKPPLLPPARPASLQKPVEDGAGAAAEPATDLAAAIIPEARPGDDLAHPAAVPLPADPRLAGARPRARPLSAEALADAARAGSQTASLALGGQGPVSPYAVALSARPAPRPGNFSQAVEAAVAAALQDSGTALALAAPEGTAGATIRLRDPTAEELAALDPGALDEPEPVAAAPRAPISGSVAKRATFVNGFNLSKTGLIGVYGTSSQRYALVRQSNGRIKRVEVGDKVDGGVVAAITTDELRYQKGGRMYALKIPSG